MPHFTHPCVKQSILINISCNENLLIRKSWNFSAPRGSQILVFAFFWYLYVLCHFLGDHLGKIGEETKSRPLFTVWSVWTNLLKVQSHSDPQTIWLTLIPIHKPSFMYIWLGNINPPSPPKPAALIYRLGESSTSHRHAAFIILSFWIISSDGLAAMTDTFLRVEQLQPGSPACPGKPGATPCQTREGRPSVWPGGCTNTA